MDDRHEEERHQIAWNFRVALCVWAFGSLSPIGRESHRWAIRDRHLRLIVCLSVCIDVTIMITIMEQERHESLKTLKYWDQQKTHGFMSFIESQNLVSKLVCLNHGCLVPPGCLMSRCLLMYYHSWKRTILLVLIRKVMGSNVGGNPRGPHGWAILLVWLSPAHGNGLGLLNKDWMIIHKSWINLS